MNPNLFHRFAPVIRSLSSAELAGAPSLYDKLTLAEEGNLRVCYAPFEHINPSARVVIVGITPGHTQMLNALIEARRQLDMDTTEALVLKAAKATGAFSGAIRPNLTGLLDAVGIHQWLGIKSCSELFGSAADLVQTTSVLRNPVFVQGANYNGSPSMTENTFLQKQLTTHFAQDIAALPNALYVPLGDKVANALHVLAAEGWLQREQILDGLPHPSGANAERIAYFMGRKLRSELSPKTNPDKLDEARAGLMHRVKQLGQAISPTPTVAPLPPDDRATSIKPNTPSQTTTQTQIAMPIKIEEIEALLQARGYTLQSATLKKRAYQKGGQLPVYLNLTSKSGATSLVIHPEVQVETWRDKVSNMSVTTYHSSNMRLFPKRMHRGENPIPFGWGLTFESLQSVCLCLDHLENKARA